MTSLPLALAAALLAAPDVSEADVSEATEAPAPESVALSPEEVFEEAVDLYTKGERASAIQLLQSGVERHPGSGRLHRALGVLFRETHRLGKAEASFRRATELDPGDALAWADLAAALERRGAYRDALDAANRAADLAPDDAGIRGDRAVIRYRLGETDAAIVDGALAVARRGDDPDLLLDHAWMRLARGEEADRVAAVDLLVRARSFAPGDDAIALAHAHALLAAGRTAEAAVAFDRLLERNPRQGWAAFGRALAAFREGDRETARRKGAVARSVLPHVFKSSDRKSVV